MVPAIRLLIGTLLYLQRVQGNLNCEIQQQELIIVAVVNESVRIHCAFQCHQPKPPENVTVPAPKPADFTVNLYKDYLRIVTTCSGSTKTLAFTAVCELTVRDTQDSGMYSCRRVAASNKERGEPTFLQVQNAVNIEASSLLQYALAALCLILALYSVSATSVVLIKRKACNSCVIWQKKSTPAGTPPQSPTHEVPPRCESQQENKSQSAESADSDNAYMPLQKHQQSIYSTLDHDRTSNYDCSGRNKPPTELGAEGYDCVYESF
ncbi:uncharacterized protein LOC144509147 [Mustelus asterias]